MNAPLTRREAIGTLAALCGGPLALESLAAPAGGFRLASFSADVTPPIGHPLLAGLVPPTKAVDDLLSAHGFVLLEAEKPVVLVSVDWCEIRNESHDRWREA